MTKAKNLKKKCNRYEELIKLGQLIYSSMGFDNIQKRVSGKIAKLLDCEKVLIYKYNESTDQLYYSSHVENQKVEYSFALDDNNFVGQCGRHKSILHIKDPMNDIRIAKEGTVIKSLRPRNMLLAPLVYQGETLGVIQAVNTYHTDFDEEDYHFIEVVTHQLASCLENSILIEKITNQFYQVVQAMADAIGKKDSYTGGHTKRVSLFAEMIGKEMDLPYEQMRDLRLAAVLHDIGKIGIDDKILRKSAPLDDEEFEIMKNHPRLGYEILGHIDGLENVIDGMRFHHERPDGKGYPFGLKGDEIPVIASIISVADTFDAMISTRPYRKGLPPMVAYEEVIKFSGTQFDERVVTAFVKGFRKTKMYREELDSYKKAG